MNLFDFFFFLGPFVICFPVVVVAPIIGVMLFIMWRASVKGRRDVIVTAISTEKRVINKNTLDIWTCKLETGETAYFYNGQNLLVRKFLPHVLDIQAKFEHGAKYRLTVAGIKKDFLGIFQNILKAEKLS